MCMISCNYWLSTEVKYDKDRTVSKREYIKRRLIKMLLGFLLLGFWLALPVYCFWYFFLAKTVQPLTLDDLALIWKLHKLHTGCKSRRIHSLLESKNEVIGFKCDCGYEFKQKRLITQRAIKKYSRYIATSNSSQNFAMKEEEKQ